MGWPFPEFAISQQIYLWFFITVLAPLVTIGVALWARSRDPDPRRAHALLVLGLFGLGLITQALQRADETHLSWVSVITIASLPAAIAEFLVVRPARRPLWSKIRIPLTASVAALFFFAVIAPQTTVRSYADGTLQTFGHDIFGFPVSRNGRNFYLPREALAAPAQQMIDKFDSLHPRPGQRLFVGPADLRYTPYTDAYFYYLFPELDPATYYIEMDPFDSGPHTRLAADVNSADWIILTNVWSGWVEPNQSIEPGSNKPNEIIQRDFCKVGSWGQLPDNTGKMIPTYQLYRRCKPHHPLS